MMGGAIRSGQVWWWVLELAVPGAVLKARDEGGRLRAQEVGQARKGGLLLICRHMRHQRQVLHQAAALPLWRVCRAQHAPLAWLQCARPTHLRTGPSAGDRCLAFMSFGTSRQTQLVKIRLDSNRAPYRQTATLRVFSNCEVMRVIMPRAAMKDRRESTCAKCTIRRQFTLATFLAKDSTEQTQVIKHVMLAGIMESPAHLGDTLAFHAEAADGPVATADGALHALADHLHMQILGCIKLARPISFGQCVVRLQQALKLRQPGVCSW